MVAAYAHSVSTPAETVTCVKQELARRTVDSRFATLFYGVLTPDGRLTSCNAGHNPPFVVGQRGVRRLETGGLIIGAFKEITFAEETVQLDPRRRRLYKGEGERLLPACTPHLRGVVECALETAMRRGEILSLQWWQVRPPPKAELFLPAVKTKTKMDRTVPISSRLQAILDMRRAALRTTLELKPDEELSGELYVFGNEIGDQAGDIKRAWNATVLRAHGHKPAYTKTGNLKPDVQKALNTIDLNFHDLRREAGSRWSRAGFRCIAFRSG
jgi:integrase